MLNLRLLPLLWIWPPQSITNRSRGEGDDLDRNYSRCDFLLQGTVLVLQMTERPYKVEVSDPSHKIHTRTFGKLWNAYGCAMEAVVEGPPGTRVVLDIPGYRVALCHEAGFNIKGVIHHWEKKDAC